MVARRDLLRALAAAPLAAIATRADARDYANAREALGAIDALSADSDRRLASLAHAMPSAAAFAESARADLARHRRRRAALRRARGFAEAASVAPSEVDEPRSLPLLKRALEDLMHAHAEGLPAMLGDAELVQEIAEQMVDLSRLVTVVDLWLLQEGHDE